ncbi:MAG: translation elongation factor Ts [Eubacteriales bacterium]|nr:translation elongation factor Ts [Eubacteriales bacterium]NCA99849.1 translation elongation factor Ts [Clostridia bacterium]NCC76023.1 translation elongation factor Ts [Clostridia bacterium]
MAITTDMIKTLREKTGSGMMDCKKALTETNGDMDKAVAWLREKGIASADKKASRVAAEGIVDAYIHAEGRIGVLIEVNIETDFAAKNEEFRRMVRDLGMQVAAMNPRWVSKEEVPAEELEKEKTIIRNKALNEGKPEKILDRIVEGSLNKFYEENCLLEMAYVKDDSKKISQLVKEMIAKIGENITVRRFVRFELGEGIQKKEENFADEVMKQIK